MIDSVTIPAVDAFEAVHANCDCGNRDGEQVFESSDRRFSFPGRFGIVRCERCSLVRTTPRPVNPGSFYPVDEYYSHQPPAPPSARVRERFLAAYGPLDPATPRFRRLAARLGRDALSPGLPPGPVGRILDVGCGSGAFLLALQEAGWDCHGIELDPSAVAAARSAGLDNVREGDLLAAALPARSFDVVRFWHCLEHVESPREQLREAHRLLRPGGHLVVGVPNFAALLSRVGRDRWFHLDVPRHLWHFEKTTLGQVAVDAGFSVRRLKGHSTGTGLLGTIDFALNTGERLLNSRAAWYASLPIARTLDPLGLGDALVLVARA